MSTKKHLLYMMFFAFTFTNSLIAATYTVSKDGSAMYATIQAAIDKSKAGDTVKILDAATYPEQVTINDLHNGITLTSANPTSPGKPKIIWQDKVNEGPQTCRDAQVDSLITFDHNGALRLMRARNVMINGIIVDGGGVMPFGSAEKVLGNCKSPLLHGNTAILLWIAGDIVIRNCEAQNAYIGIYLKDRNEGGIFANANPGDNAPWDIVPLYSFAQSGNHLIEYNRIHDNSWGIYVESAWDLGSTIRYNLIYENHHPTAALAAQVKALNSAGATQPGGAMFFKDDMLSPLSIYNNTFWHNFLIFCGAWQAGYQHLIFNNIFARPFVYWINDPVFSASTYMELTPVLANRITNCVYSSQSQPSSTSWILSGLPAINQAISGSLLSTTKANTAFPITANNRWLEMDTAFFISVDPAQLHFLEPNWSDTLVQKYIKNQGWQKSGVKNLDGSWADIGAVHSSGGIPVDLAALRPIMPVQLNGANATVNFNLVERIGKMQNPSIRFFRLISNLKAVTDSWSTGADDAVIGAADINDIPIPATPVKVGENNYFVTIPMPQTSPYAFFEAVIEGTGSDGKLYTTSTGFLPFRILDYKFLVQVFTPTDISFTKPLTQAATGDSLVLRITPLTSDGTSFSKKVDKVSIRLESGLKLLAPPFRANQDTALSYSISVTGPTDKTVMFTGVPLCGGFEYVYATGLISTSDSVSRRQILGVSNSIRIVPGSTAVSFQNPRLIKNIPLEKKQLDISCFDLQGRRIFHSVKESNAGRIQAGNFQHLWRNDMASGAYIVKISITQGQSRPLTSLNKIMVR